MTKTGPRDDTKLAAIKLEWWPRSDWNRWPPSLESAHGFLRKAVVVSDDAGQFDIGKHALCWVHAERLVHILDKFTDLHRAAPRRAASANGSGPSTPTSKPIAPIPHRGARQPS